MITMLPTLLPDGPFFFGRNVLWFLLPSTQYEEILIRNVLEKYRE